MEKDESYDDRLRSIVKRLNNAVNDGRLHATGTGGGYHYRFSSF
jgi:hypothetical protein